LQKEKSSLVLSNRRRGKATERRVAKLLSGKRVGILGREDILTEIFVVEVKNRKKLAFVKWFEQVLKHAEKEKKIPLVVCKEYGKKKYYAILNLEDLLRWIRK